MWQLTRWWHSRRESRKRSKFEVLLEWRTELNQYERDLLIPELIGRLRSLHAYCVQLLADCEKGLHDPAWAAMVDRLVNPGEVREGDAATGAMYFGALMRSINESYVGPLDAALKKLADVADFKTLGAALNEVGLICESITGVEEKLLVFSMRGVAIVTDRTGGAVVSPPRELELIMLPFRLIRDQLVLIATSTASSIQAWRSAEVQTKPRFLELELALTNLRNSNRALWINLLAVVVAVGLSAFFLVAADPFQLLSKNREAQGQLAEANARLRSMAAEADVFRSAVAAKEAALVTVRKEAEVLRSQRDACVHAQADQSKDLAPPRRSGQ